MNNIIIRPKSITVFIGPVLLTLILIIALSARWSGNLLLIGLIIIFSFLSVNMFGSYIVLENNQLKITEFFFRTYEVDVRNIKKIQQRSVHATGRSGSVRLIIYDVFTGNSIQKLFSFHTRPYTKQQLTLLFSQLQMVNPQIVLHR